jgi:hypothetical protein
MGLPLLLVAAVPIVCFCFGVGLIRRDRRRLGAVIVALAPIVAAAFAASGNWRPLGALIAVSAFLGGLEADLPGHPARRALGLLGITVGLFALLATGLYT